jgi:hypothetical protein
VLAIFAFIIGGIGVLMQVQIGGGFGLIRITSFFFGGLLWFIALLRSCTGCPSSNVLRQMAV